jgi:predicted PurR-regulated permease PerM
VSAGLIAITGLVLLWATVAISSIWATLPRSDSWLIGYETTEEVKARRAASILGLHLVDAALPLSGQNTLHGLTPALVEDWAQRAVSEPQSRSAYQRVHDRVANEFNKEIADQLFPPDPKQSFIYGYVKPLMDEQTQLIPTYVTKATEQILFILFLVLFLLVEGDMLMRRTGEIFGPSTGEYAKAATKALENMATQVRAYLVWRTIINMAMALLLGLIYKYALGLSFPWVWAILAGVLTYVPYIGPILAFVPTAVDAMFSPGGGVWALIAVLVLYSMILFAEGYIVFPLVIGRNMEMNATTVMLACLFWWLVWGEVGLFLALPLMGAIRAICQNVPGWEPWANLMGMETHGQPGSARRGRLRRFLALLLSGPLLPLARWLNVEKWARLNAPPRPEKGSALAGDGNGQMAAPPHSQVTEESEKLAR